MNGNTTASDWLTVNKGSVQSALQQMDAIFGPGTAVPFTERAVQVIRDLGGTGLTHFYDDGRAIESAFVDLDGLHLSSQFSRPMTPEEQAEYDAKKVKAA